MTNMMQAAALPHLLSHSSGELQSPSSCRRQHPVLSVSKSMSMITPSAIKCDQIDHTSAP